VIRRLAVALLASAPLLGQAAPPADLIQASGKICKHGLHEQPTRNFSVFLFCDDAQGSNIGIVLSSPGPGPVEGEPPHKWGIARRFWQTGPWVTDVTSFAWSPSGRYLYVATSPIYGDGGLFELDLIRQEWKRLIPEMLKPAIRAQCKESKENCYTRIERVDRDKKSITVGIYDLDEDKQVATQEIAAR
jgi:hypothetical protein